MVNNGLETEIVLLVETEILSPYNGLSIHVIKTLV